jgi:AcrR family transcriptional regulator
MPTPDDHDVTRVRLLEAAEDVFAEKGFEAATTREICERAQVKNTGAINYYFQNKERLYAEAVKYAMRTCAKDAPIPVWPPGTAPIQKLRDFIRMMLGRLLEIPKESSMALMTRELTRLSPTPLMREAVHENIKPMADVLGHVLAELVPDMPLEQRVLVGFSVMGQCLFYRQSRAISEILFGNKATKNFDVDYLANHVADFTLAALHLNRRKRT